MIEEGTEFLERKAAGGTLPMFTSCCPGWVKYAEQYFPELLPNLSTCRSPQAMFGSLVKAMLPDQLKVERKDLKVVAIMPCTAKKFEAQRPEMGVDGDPDVDYVLTTQELAQMIQSAGIIFDTLAARILRYALRLLHRRWSHLRKLGRRDGSRTALRRGKGHGQEAGAR